MIIINKLVIVILIQISLIVAEPLVEKYPPEFKECLESTDVKIEDLQALKKDDKLSENQLCFMKCVMEKTKKLKPDGSVDLENSDEFEKFSKLSEYGKINIKKCLQEVGKVVECADMEKFEICFEKLEM